MNKKKYAPVLAPPTDEEVYQCADLFQNGGLDRGSPFYEKPWRATKIEIRKVLTAFVTQRNGEK